MEYKIKYELSLAVIFLLIALVAFAATVIMTILIKDSNNFYINPEEKDIPEEKFSTNISLNDNKNDIHIVENGPTLDQSVVVWDDVSESVNEIPEVIVPEEPETPVVETVEESVSSSGSFTDEEIDLIALVTMAEAEGENELGKRLVIDVVLNRVDSDAFPDTVYDVIYQQNQFTSMTNGRADRCYVQDEIRALVLEEIESRTNSDVLYFRAGRYHSFGTPVLQEGNHYFSC